MNAKEFEKLNIELYLTYAMQTLGGRAIPFVHDGLKPVHRRILYAMRMLHLSSSSDYKKSARVVGDTIGKYHPHGDASVYEAMVLMSQPWKMRYPIIDGQGNFGSREGDSWAAMRYTEARLTPVGDILLDELDSGSVEFKTNFDDSMKEPKYLNSSLPILLMNGAEGIAVGAASNVPSHNIGELRDAILATIKNPDITVEEIMEHIKGPDLPVGGHIVNDKKSILEAYRKGYGNLRVRCRWKTIEKQRNQWEIEITEMPPKMDPNKVLTLINEALKPDAKDKDGKSKTNPKILDRRTFLKNSVESVDDITDAATSKVGGARMLIVPKKCNIPPEDFMNSFMKLFDLEETMKFNLMSISTDNRPKSRAIKQILEEWIEYRRVCIIRRTQARLEKIALRLEILIGRLTIMNHIDRVIEIIREDEDPEVTLMSEFSLTERQAKDIMDIKLRELRRLEEEKFQNEKMKLETEQADLEALIASKVKMNNLIGRELKKNTDRFVDERRTLVEEAAPLSNEIVQNVSNDPITIFTTKDNWLIARKGHLEEYPQGAGLLKPQDEFIDMIHTTMDSEIIFFSATGRAYTIKSIDVSSGRNMSHITTLANCAGEAFIKRFAYEEGKKYILAHEEGYGFIVSSESLYSKQKTGKDVFNLKKYPDAKINLMEDIEGKDNLCIVTSRNRMLRFPMSEMKDYEYPKGQGVKLAVLTGEIVTEYNLVNEEFIINGVVTEINNPEKFHKNRSKAPAKID